MIDMGVEEGFKYETGCHVLCCLSEVCLEGTAGLIGLISIAK
jgi:hypothetical protein